MMILLWFCLIVGKMCIMNKTIPIICIVLFVAANFMVIVYLEPESIGLTKPYTRVGAYDGAATERALMISEQCLDKKQNPFGDYAFARTSNGAYYIDNVICERINVHQGGCLEPFSKGYPDETCKNRVTFDYPYGETGPEINKEFCNKVKSEPSTLNDSKQNKDLHHEYLNICTIRGLIDIEFELISSGIESVEDKYAYIEPQFREEHYSIEITGMKDIYRIGEQYDFSYIISGYGYSCGSKEITFPDQNGNTMKIISSSSCIAGVPMKEFVIDSQKEYDMTSVHGTIKIPGIYNVIIAFDRPSQDFPTTAIKEFRVPPINSWYNNQMKDADLQTVMNSCANDSPKERMINSLRYTNNTHVFLNLGCEWKKIGVFVGN